MRIPGKRRLLLAAGTAATVGAVATLVSGVTFGLFSSQTTGGTNTFTAGTVTLTQDVSSAPCVVGTGNSASGSATTDTVTAPSSAFSSVLFTGGANYVGWTITDTANGIPSGTTIVAENNTTHVVTLSTNGATSEAAGTDQLTVTTTNIVPGDGSAGWSLAVLNTAAGTDPTCTFKVNYAGNPAYLGVDAFIETQNTSVSVPNSYSPGSTGTAYLPTALFDETATGLQLQLTDSINGASTYFLQGFKQGNTAPATIATETPGTGQCPASGWTCYEVTNLLVSATPSSSGTNTSDTFKLDYALPSTATNAYQGGVAKVILTAHAVQAANNTIGACTAANSCGTLTWS